MIDSRLADILNGREANYLLPFYWQHGDHTERIPQQVQEIFDSGARALCVESRPHKNFCGPEWWQDMDVILRECSTRGMKVWILDDDHFPTGHANGGIAKKHPELRQWTLDERHVDVIGPMPDASLLTEPENEDLRLLGAYALRRCNDAEESCTGDPIELTSHIRNGVLYWDIPDGIWRVFFYTMGHRGGRKDYIDMISAESVRVLIDEVYEPHWAHYKAEFGKTIAGFFSDEPQFGNQWYGSGRSAIYDQKIGTRALSLPWNNRVRAMMAETLGYDPLPFLHALWFEDERRPQMRFAYMDAVTRLYSECFSGQLASWCHAHGVEYIGHIIEDMNAHAHLGYSAGHYFRALRPQDMSGIDVVLHQIIPGMTDTIHSASVAGNKADPEFYDYVLAKLGASLAHLEPHMQGRAMCEIFGAYGWAEDSSMQKALMDHMLVRGINHFVPHAFSPSFPDPDCPPHFGAEGHDPSFPAFSALMHYTNQVAHLLCGADHVASAALLYHAEGEWSSKLNTAMLVQKPAKVLYDHHFDYDIVPMDFLLHAETENGQLKINRAQYGCLIVPAADHLPEMLITALTRLHEQGLPIWFVDAAPAGLSFAAEIVPLSAIPERMTAQNLTDVRVPDGNPHLRVYHAHRAQIHYFFFVNEDAHRAMHDAVGLPCRGHYARLDLLNDSCTCGDTSDGLVDLDLLPRQSQLLVFADCVLPPEYTVHTLSDLKPHFTLELASSQSLTVFEPYMEGDKFFNVTGAAAKPDFSGKMRYRFTIDIQTDIGNRLFLNLGRVGQNAELKINGVDCGIRICAPYRFEITHAACAGQNEVEVIVSNTLVQQLRDPFSRFLCIAPSGLLGGLTLEAAES